jgi:RNA polymerase sigma-70 factor (ECF subfamily)
VIGEPTQRVVDERSSLFQTQIVEQRVRRFFSDIEGSQDESAPKLEWEAPDTLLNDLSLEQRRALIDDALRRLPDHQRLPLVLYHFENLSYEEIAGRLRVSLAKIKTDIRRARAAMLPLLQSQGMTRDSLDT